MMEQKELISVIVPVYNCEQYLRQCLDSIVNQTYKNLEIILVDDGSKDSSGKICDEYTAKDKRIRVIHQANAGQIAARVTGIKVSKGEYIGFVDSDDWIDKEMYSSLADSIASADLATCGIWRYDENENLLAEWTDLLEEGLYATETELAELFENLIIAKNYDGGTVIGGITNNNVSKLFRATIAKKIAEQVGDVRIRGEEDLLFNLLYILQCKSVNVTHKCLYHYRNNTSSVCHTFYPHYLTDCDVLYETVRDAIIGHPYEKTLLEQWQRRFCATTINRISRMLQFQASATFPVWFPPFLEKLHKKNIVLFGAGKVGQSYAKWFKALNICEPLWVDNKPAGNVLPPAELKGRNFDVIVIAVAKTTAAQTIRAQLVALGVPDEKILWQKPVNVLHKMLLENSSHWCGGESIV